MSYTIETAEPFHIPVIQSIAQIAYPVAYRGIHSEEQNLFMMRNMYATENLLDLMEKEGMVFLILSVGNKPSGYLGFKKQNQDPLPAFYLDKLYILPQIKGQGYGKVLMEKMIEIIKKDCPQGATIELHVNRSNSAVEFYKHFGFVIEDSFDAPVGCGFMMNAYRMKLSL